MSSKTIAQLFAQKTQGKEAVLGAATGEVVFDNKKNRHFQLFEHGVILAKVVNPTKPSQLTCTYGKLFHAWWGNPGAAWLEEPLEDLYETTNAEGFQIMVQRFAKGVINCRSDGANDVQWLSWRDWHAISRPGDNRDTPPSK